MLQQGPICFSSMHIDDDKIRLFSQQRQNHVNRGLGTKRELVQALRVSQSELGCSCCPPLLKELWNFLLRFQLSFCDYVMLFWNIKAQKVGSHSGWMDTYDGQMHTSQGPADNMKWSCPNRLRWIEWGMRTLRGGAEGVTKKTGAQMRSIITWMHTFLGLFVVVIFAQNVVKSQPNHYSQHCNLFLQPWLSSMLATPTTK